MKTIACLLLAVAPLPLAAQQGVELMDTHTFAHLMVDELELADGSGDSYSSWDADFSVGGDLNRFWLKTEGRRSDDHDRTELQLLYGRAILPFWDLHVGLRRDLDPTPGRNWAVVSLSGLTPYFFDVEAELFLAEGGQSSFRIRSEYELLLTQRWILSPEFEIAAYGRDEPNRLVGSGLGEIGFDLRLRYEIKREIAPYIGIGWHRSYGRTRQFAVGAGEASRDTVFKVGIRAWY